MPIDREKGELLPLHGPHDHVAKWEVWTEYCSAFKVTIEVARPNGKFGYDKKEISVFEAAQRAAIDAFVEAGALLPIIFDHTSMICQEYHGQGIIVIIAQHKVGGEEKFVVLPFALSKGQVRWLVQTKRWKLKGGKTFHELARARQNMASEEELSKWQNPSATQH